MKGRGPVTLHRAPQADAHLLLHIVRVDAMARQAMGSHQCPHLGSKIGQQAFDALMWGAGVAHGKHSSLVGECCDNAAQGRKRSDAAGESARDIALQLRQLLGLFVDHCLDQIPDRDDAHHTAVFDHRQVAHATVGTQTHAIFHGLGGADGQHG